MPSEIFVIFVNACFPIAYACREGNLLIDFAQIEPQVEGVLFAVYEGVVRQKAVKHVFGNLISKSAILESANFKGLYIINNFYTLFPDLDFVRYGVIAMTVSHSVNERVIPDKFLVFHTYAENRVSLEYHDGAIECLAMPGAGVVQHVIDEYSGLGDVCRGYFTDMDESLELLIRSDITDFVTYVVSDVLKH